MAGPSAPMETEENPTRERDIEINKLVAIVKIIIVELGDAKCKEVAENSANFVIDIDLSDEIAGFLMTVFTCLRKEENDKAGHMRFLEYTAKISGIDIAVKTVVEKIKAAKIEINFMICTPIVEIITVFRAFYDEVRTGVTRFRVRESVAKRGMKRTRDGKVVPQMKSSDYTQNISQYGLTNQHVALLHGVTLQIITSSN